MMDPFVEDSSGLSQYSTFGRPASVFLVHTRQSQAGLLILWTYGACAEIRKAQEPQRGGARRGRAHFQQEMICDSNHLTRSYGHTQTNPSYEGLVWVLWSLYQKVRTHFQQNP